MIPTSSSDNAGATTTAVLPKLLVSVNTKERVQANQGTKAAILAELIVKLEQLISQTGSKIKIDWAGRRGKE